MTFDRLCQSDAARSVLTAVEALVSDASDLPSLSVYSHHLLPSGRATGEGGAWLWAIAQHRRCLCAPWDRPPCLAGGVCCLKLRVAWRDAASSDAKVVSGSARRCCA